MYVHKQVSIKEEPGRNTMVEVTNIKLKFKILGMNHRERIPGIYHARDVSELQTFKTELKISFRIKSFLTY
jgi:hypothetical protein